MAEPESEDKTFSKSEVEEMIKKAQLHQLEVDEMRTYGNMFFAEALDHVGTLAKADPVWARVYAYGRHFRHQFEINTGQKAAEPVKQESEKPAKETSPA